MPDFWDAKRSIDGEFGARFICRVDLDGDVRWRIRVEIDLMLPHDAGGVGNIKTGVRLGTFLEPPPLPGC